MALRQFARRACCVLAVALVAAACDNGEITNQIVSQSTSGSADDGNSNNDPPNGKSYPPNMQATDNTTQSGSDAPTSVTVGGFVKAVPAAPQGATSDVARATSFNGVKTVFVVSKAAPFTFDLDLNVAGARVTRNARLTIRARANVLDANGATIPNAQITDVEFTVDVDANGRTQITPGGTPPEAFPANGNYNRRLSGPNGGIQLQPGNYQIELELRLVATASTSPGGDSATLDHATASIRLR